MGRYLCYLVGALLYNVNCGAALLGERCARDAACGKLAVELPAALGGALFAAGGLIEMEHNRVIRSWWPPRLALPGPAGARGGVARVEWWLSVLNFAGGFSFLVAGALPCLALARADDFWGVAVPPGWLGSAAR